MSTITPREQPTLTTHTACTGHEYVRYTDPTWGTIEFVGIDGSEGGTDGEVEIFSRDSDGGLERVHQIPRADWEHIVQHVNESMRGPHRVRRFRVPRRFKRRTGR
jgi:hypothetical protein